jgi:hypothetical protein
VQPFDKPRTAIQPGTKNIFSKINQIFLCPHAPNRFIAQAIKNLTAGCYHIPYGFGRTLWLRAIIDIWGKKWFIIIIDGNAIAMGYSNHFYGNGTE